MDHNWSFNCVYNIFYDQYICNRCNSLLHKANSKNKFISSCIQYSFMLPEFIWKSLHSDEKIAPLSCNEIILKNIL